LKAEVTLLASRALVSINANYYDYAKLIPSYVLTSLYSTKSILLPINKITISSLAASVIVSSHISAFVKLVLLVTSYIKSAPTAPL